MQKKQIDFFFRELDKELGMEAEIILLGASAGSLMGNIRPSMDIDFEIRSKEKIKNGEEFNEKIRKTAEKASVAAQYSEDIGHWSMVNFLDYRKTARPYKKFGKLNVKLLAPEYWTIGKIARYLALDGEDVAAIIRAQKIKPGPLVDLWKRALDSSALCPELGLFKKHAVDFFKNQGTRLWGKDFNYQSYAKRLD